MPPAPPLDARAAPFVGRSLEIHHLRAARDAVLGGAGAFVAVSGEPGVGKTRLLHHVLDDGLHPTHWAFNAEHGGAPAYWPLTQLLRGIRLARGSTRYQDMVGDQVLLGVIDPLSVPLSGAAPTISDLDRFRLLDRVTNALQALAADEPLLLVVDDLQWADPSTLRLVEFLATTARDAAIGLFTTVRSDEPGAPEALDTLLRHFTTLHLGRFDRPTTEAWLRGAKPGLDDPRYVDAAWSTSGGNAFLLSEYVQLVIPGQPFDVAMFGHRADRLLAGRTSQLSPEAIAILRAAAVIGNRFEPDLVGEIAPGSMAQVRAALDEADTLGLTEPAGSAHTFCHGLTRDGINHRLEPGERRRLHRAAAEALERRHRAEQPDTSARIAHHWLEVGDDEARRRALGHLRAAARAADQRFARDDAVRRYREALAVVATIPEASPTLEIDLLLGLGSALHALAETDEARAVLRAAAATADRLDDAERFALVALAFPPGLEGVSMMPTADPEQVELRRRALERLPTGDHRLRAELLSGLATSLYWTAHTGGQAHRFDESLEEQDALSAEALAMARRLGDPSTIAVCLLGRLHATWGPDSAQQRPSLVDELLLLARDTGNFDLLAAALAWRILSCLDAGDLNSAAIDIDAYEQLAERTSQPLYRRTARQWRALLQVLRGDIDAGVDTTFAALTETAGLIGDQHALGDAIMLQSVQLFFHGDLSAIIEPARTVIATNQRISLNWQIGLTFALAELGELTEARSLFDQLCADDLTRVPRDLNWLVGMQLLALTASHLEDRPVAARLYAALEPHAHRDAIHGWGYASYGPVGWALGELAGLMGDIDAAVRHLRTVCATREVGPYRAVAELRLAEIEHRHDLAPVDDVRARGVRLASAFRNWGIDRFARRADALVLEAGGTLGSDQQHLITRTQSGWRWVAEGLVDAEFPATRGMDHLVALVASGGEIHALELVRDGASAAPSQDRPTEPGDLHLATFDLGDVIDATARAAYTRRIELLDREHARRHDPDQVAAIESELAVLRSELARATSLGGRSRRTNPEVERARVSVTKAIRRTVAALSDRTPRLARHLDATIRTGTYCAYEGSETLSWHVVRRPPSG